VSQRSHSPAHGHSHAPADAPVSAHTAKVVNWILIPSAVLTVVALILLWPGHSSTPSVPAGSGDQRGYGEVLTVTRTACPVPDGTTTGGPRAGQACGSATVHISSGAGSGQTVKVDLPHGAGAPSLAVGDKVVLSHLATAPPGVAAFSVIDHQRGRPLVLMLAVCALVIV